MPIQTLTRISVIRGGLTGLLPAGHIPEQSYNSLLSISTYVDIFDNFEKKNGTEYRTFYSYSAVLCKNRQIMLGSLKDSFRQSK